MSGRKPGLVKRAGSVVLVALLLATVVPAAHAEGLRARLDHIFSRKARVYDRIRVIKRQQSSATERLWTAQAELARVQSRLRTARGQLIATRRELAATQAELDRLVKRTKQHKADVQSHLLALYRSGANSYLDVVLQADSFSDFSNREHVVQAIANQDEYLLTRLTALDAECLAKRNELQSKEQRRASLVSEIASDEATVHARTAEVHQILAAANQKRSAAEEALAEMENEENSVRAMIRARMRGSSGGGYSGHYAGSWAGSFLKPASGRISSAFGMRVHPITGRYKLHTGVDIAAGSGAPIRAAANGMVISTGWMRAYGQVVVIDHGSGMHTWYCHCSSIDVSEGQVVKRGQTIARVGSTGMSTGPHLHFSVLRNGDFVNPMG